jgi:hypothetical protein
MPMQQKLYSKSKPAMLDIAKVLDYPVIDRSVGLPSASVRSPPKNMKSPTKRRLEHMLKLEEKTPMRVTVRVQADSQEKKRQLHQKQGNKTIQDQEKSMKLQGATPSAVVIVKVDYCTIRGAIEIVGIIYKIANGSGARIATVKQILSNRPRRGHWWIPADQYMVKFGAKELAVVKQQWPTTATA